jgi:hypothetical protein
MLLTLHAVLVEDEMTRSYFADILPGLATRSIQTISQLSPTAYAASRTK